MAQPGRKSATEASVVRLATTGHRPKLSPPSSLTKDERSIFNLIVSENRHLTPTDMPMVAAFAQASVKVFELAKKDDVQEWERACRIQAMYATKLRLTPQSTQDPQTLGRRRKDYQPSPLDEFLANEDDADDDQ